MKTYLLILSVLAASAAQAASGLLNIPLKTIDGKETNLGALSAKAYLVVNTASKCGFTPQYEGLQKLYRKWKPKGVVVVGFPSNDFGGQEPGTNAEIKSFCELKYRVEFPLFAKAPVSGPERQPLYSALVGASGSAAEVEWNFEKFVVDRSGKVIARFKSSTEPSSPELEQALQKALDTP